MPAFLRNLAACTAAFLTVMSAAPAKAEGVGAYYIFSTLEYSARAGLALMLNGDIAMHYYGGSVFSNVRVVSVMWGAYVDPAIVSGVLGFSQAIVDSTYVDQMKEYDTFLNAF